MSGFGPVRAGQGQVASAPYGFPGVEEITTLWIGNCRPGTTDEQLAIAMAPFGELIVSFLLKSLSPQGQMSGFVRYRTRAEAAAALEAITGGKVMVHQSVISGKFANKNSEELKDPVLAAQRKAIIQAAYMEASRSQAEPERQPEQAAFPALAPVPPPVLPVQPSAPPIQPPVQLLVQPIGQLTDTQSLLLALERFEPASELEALQMAINEQALKLELEQEAAQKHQAMSQEALSQQALQKILSQGMQGAASPSPVPREAPQAPQALGQDALQQILAQNMQGAASLSQAPQEAAPQQAPQALSHDALQQILAQNFQGAASLSQAPQEAAPHQAPQALSQEALQQIFAQNMQEVAPQQAPQALSHEFLPQILVQSLQGANPSQPPPLELAEEITTLWIGNCPPNTGDAELAASMAPYGPLLACFLMKKLSPQGQMSGFVRYQTRAHAASALEHIMGGRVVVKGAAVSGKFASKNSKPLADPNLAAQRALMLQAASSAATAPPAQLALPAPPAALPAAAPPAGCPVLS